MKISSFFKKYIFTEILKFITIFIVIVFLCIVPTVSDLFSYNKTHVQVERVGVQYASVKNTEVTQVIYLDGHMSNLGISFYAPSGKLYDDANLSITISQNEKSITENVLAAKLCVYSPYEVDYETSRSSRNRDEVTYFIKSKLWDFSQGEAIVTICSKNLPEGTDLFCEVSSTLVSGLPSAMAGINILGKPLVLEYDLFRFDAHFWYEFILLIVLIFVCLFTSWLLVFKKFWFSKFNLLFLCSAIIIFLTISIRIPYASFWGEPRSEAVYEFWYKAESMGLLKSMMSLMSGEALAWLERILMWVANAVASRKHVFIVAQMLELTWISMVTSMPCVKSFRHFFSDETRLLLSLFLGTGIMFDSAYFFWGCSYWGILFLLMFSLLPLDNLKPIAYWSGIALAIVLCVSRIYHVLLIPLAVIAALVLKKRGKRFIFYCLSVACASLFQGVYSFSSETNLAHKSNLIVDIQDIGVARMIENTLYYQVQAINSFFTGSEHWQGSSINILSFVIFLIVIFVFICCVVKKKIEIACWIGGLGYLSLGTIAINVYTAGSKSAVFFPRNYSSKVNWCNNIYQEADFHFSYSFFCLFFLIAALVFLFSKGILNEDKKVVDSYNFDKIEKICSIIPFSVFSIIFILSASFNAKERLSYYKLSVEWQSVYEVTENEPYFLAVNTFYGAAPISMEVGTDEMIFGIDNNSCLYEWYYGMPIYEIDKVYHEAAIGEVSESAERPIISVTARRSLTNFNVKYVAILKDKDGKELAREIQAQKDRRIWLDFQFNEPVLNVHSISFELDDGNPAYIQDGLQVGYIK